MTKIYYVMTSDGSLINTDHIKSVYVKDKSLYFNKNNSDRGYIPINDNQCENLCNLVKNKKVKILIC
jgi:hypothetical protein